MWCSAWGKMQAAWVEVVVGRKVGIIVDKWEQFPSIGIQLLVLIFSSNSPFYFSLSLSLLWRSARLIQLLAQCTSLFLPPNHSQLSSSFHKFLVYWWPNHLLLFVVFISRNSQERHESNAGIYATIVNFILLRKKEDLTFHRNLQR